MSFCDIWGWLIVPMSARVFAASCCSWQSLLGKAVSNLTVNMFKLGRGRNGPLLEAPQREMLVVDCLSRGRNSRLFLSSFELGITLSFLSSFELGIMLVMVPPLKWVNHVDVGLKRPHPISSHIVRYISV